MNANQKKKLLAQLVRAQISQADFAEALEYLHAHRELAASQIALRRATLLAAIVTYCRPFLESAPGANAESTHRLSVSLTKVFDTEEMTLHDSVMRLRNQALAHSDHSRDQMRPRMDGPNEIVTDCETFDLLREPLNLAMLERLVIKMRSNSQYKVFDLGSALIEGPDSKA